MTKIQLWNEVQELLAQHPTTSKKIVQGLEDLLKPKVGGGSSTNPPQEIDGVMNYWCRFHERYEPQEDMVMSKEKSKGYCKASISKWNKTNASIKKLDSQMSELVSNGEFEEAQAIAQESKELKANLNNHEHYDYDADWLAFSK
jgi:hypothetical protein